MKLLYIMILLVGCGPGQNGSTGPKGAPGQDGSNCHVATLPVLSVFAPNGGSLIYCDDGTGSVVLNGTNGLNGQDGAQGQTGATGATGHDGVPGTIITTVQFCKGFTQSYPNTFAESGVCINNVMYGVYSANGGFLAELPPGTYSSNGINSSCNFTLTANCGVSP